MVTVPTTPERLSEIERLYKRMQSWEDGDEYRDDCQCVKCSETLHLSEPEWERSPLCDKCAQDIAAAAVPDLLSEIRRLQGEVHSYGSRICQDALELGAVRQRVAALESGLRRALHLLGDAADVIRTEICDDPEDGEDEHIRDELTRLRDLADCSTLLEGNGATNNKRAENDER